MRLAVENMFPWRARSREILAYLPGWDPVGYDYANVTLDLSHTATAGSDALAMAEALGDRLVHVHLADGMGSAKDEHLVPGRGSQPCAQLLERLAARQWTGNVVVEISTRRLRDRADPRGRPGRGAGLRPAEPGRPGAGAAVSDGRRAGRGDAVRPARTPAPTSSRRPGRRSPSTATRRPACVAWRGGPGSTRRWCTTTSRQGRAVRGQPGAAVQPDGGDRRARSTATRTEIGERIVRFFLTPGTPTEGRPRIRALVAAASTHEDAARTLREFLAREIFGRVVEGLGSDQPELRGSLVASQLVGLAMARYVVHLEPLASASPQDVVRWLAPTVQRYLTGSLD